jgi:hypothetical protein
MRRGDGELKEAQIVVRLSAREAAWLLGEARRLRLPRGEVVRRGLAALRERRELLGRVVIGR